MTDNQLEDVASGEEDDAAPSSWNHTPPTTSGQSSPSTKTVRVTAMDASAGSSGGPSPAPDQPAESGEREGDLRALVMKMAGPPFVCPYDGCGKSFDRRGKLERHVVIHSDARPHVCGICGASYKRKDYLDRHILTHSAERAFKCRYEGCDKTFTDADYRRIHEKTHEARQHFCDVCGESFRQKKQLRRHQMRHYYAAEGVEGRGDKGFRCRHVGCNQLIHTWEGLMRHLKRHQPANMHECGVDGCEAKFAKFSQLVAHRKACHPKPPKPLACTLCGKRYATEKGLESHMQTVHPDGSSEPERFLCPVPGCGKTYTRRWMLSQHHRVVHLGERPFKCPYCPDAFGWKRVLQNHIASCHPEHAEAQDDDDSTNHDPDDDAVGDAMTMDMEAIQDDDHHEQEPSAEAAPPPPLPLPLPLPAPPEAFTGAPPAALPMAASLLHLPKSKGGRGKRVIDAPWLIDMEIVGIGDKRRKIDRLLHSGGSRAPVRKRKQGGSEAVDNVGVGVDVEVEVGEPVG
ncbi:unnamed protein product [Vitrella brassicaformis CCMP3155]|uniref:C2H2-type domain-containing protein n=1 Tax=Vitrella brassicaformis (strain CCMP3155) TaxID=1169540 RepID=A0A0G4GR54_VITBC|nr:unnamed protein product [Vitrella brassicaformis CCMP3155]|eukprot:CEM32828.1 unnamed protein product [Vitrella brassicaformis CCMP3155]